MSGAWHLACSYINPSSRPGEFWMKNAAVAIGFSVGVMTALQTRDPSQSRVHGGFGSMKDSSIYMFVSPI